jgi:hypothetical protein
MITASEKADSLKGHCCSGIKEDAYPFKGQCHEHDFRPDPNCPSSAISNFPQKFAAGVNIHCGGALIAANFFAMFQKIRNGANGIIRSPRMGLIHKKPEVKILVTLSMFKEEESNAKEKSKKAPPKKGV